ncbi:MAG: BglG family transcription antiterminator [Faecalibacillus sp.]
MSQDVNINKEFEKYKKELFEIVSATAKEENLALAPHIISNLSIHLAIALVRIKTNNYIPLSQGQISSYKMNSNYKIAVDLCNKLKEKYGVEFPESEEALISMYLSKLDTLDVDFNSGLNLLDDDIFTILKKTFEQIYEKTGIDFRNDEKLTIALGLHLTPAIERLLNGDQIDNPLLTKIKTRYSDSYELAQILNDFVEEIYHKRLSDDETGYLALHFAVTIKHSKKNA